MVRSRRTGQSCPVVLARKSWVFLIAVVVLAEPRLAFLGDMFHLPASWPLSNVFSIGDILIALGIAWALHRICQSRLAPSWTRQPS
jgi:Family of unknown function (DUF5317)